MITTLKILRALLLVASVSLVGYSVYLNPGVEYVLLTAAVGILASTFGIKAIKWSLEEVNEFTYGEED